MNFKELIFDKKPTASGKKAAWRSNSGSKTTPKRTSSLCNDEVYVGIDVDAVDTVVDAAVTAACVVSSMSNNDSWCRDTSSYDSGSSSYSSSSSSYDSGSSSYSSSSSSYDCGSSSYDSGSSSCGSSD